MVSWLCPGFPEELFQALADAVGADLRIATDRSGPDPDDDPFRAGEADLGFVCSTAFAALVVRPEPSVQLAGVAFAPNDSAVGGRAQYFSEVVVPASSPVTTLDELSGARIGGNDDASLSGYFALRIELARRGLDPDRFAEIVLTGAHHRSIDLVLAGELDGAVVDSMVLASRAHHDPAANSGLRVVERLGPWPTQPLVARSTLGRAELAEVRHALLAANQEPAVQALLRRSAISRLAEVGGNHCDPVLAALGAG